MDKYEKVKKIGEGSFGKAVLVKSKQDGHQYVIKEIGISGMSSKERQESRKEVAVLANMSHPNIVQYKESFEEGGCLYIVMDYCEGGDLFKKINSQKGVLFSEEQILDWFVQICLALKHVHDRKILHRDIKSQNIFLTKDGTVQLGDFGIARVLNSTVELARTCIGTPYYLSPEICENKPYNNKSDIWALGCVLYEMCTLKHAFEAGNMKNLVLKIIRGSYPPVSVHYSQELRSLLAHLFKRNPRERPSVSSILDKSFLACRIERFLTPQIIAQEFHHTFLHKQPKVGAVQGPPAKRSAPGFIPLAPAQKITKPASKYGVPLTVRKVSDAAKKPAERKPAVKHKPAPLPAAPQRRVSQVEEERKKHEDGIRKKRMELIEKERKQREQMFLLKADQMKRYEKEKINRINQAREQGWKHVLSSSGGSSPERKCYVGGGKRGVPSSVHGPTPAPAPGKSPYKHYHAALDQMAKPQPKAISREGSSAGPGGPISVPAAAGPVLPNGPAGLPDAIKRELQRLQHVSKQTHFSRQCGQMTPGRAYQVEEFLQRKKEAMLNKVRAEGQLGTRQNLTAIYGSRASSFRCRRPKANKEEEEYLSRLRQIRLQNFNERQQIKARLRGEKYDSDGSDSQESSEEAELRRKKIEALKAQANARAAVLKEQLEKKRKEAYEREKRAWEDHLTARGVKVGMAAGNVAAAAVVAVSSTLDSPSPQPSPSQPDPAAKAPSLPAPKPSTPAISMTAALKNVGAITPLKESLPEPETATVIQSEKKQILRRLNQNLKAQCPVEETEESPPPPAGPSPAPQQDQSNAEKRPSSSGDRKKWDAAELPVLPVVQQTLEETGAISTATSVSPEVRPPSGGDRKKWEAGVPLVLPVAQQTLEQTCITTIEQTAGEVIRMGVLHEEARRKVWGPDSEVLRVLQEAELQPLTQQLENVTICEEDFTSSDKPNWTAAAESVMTPKEVLPSKPTLSAAVQSPEVQKEKVHTTQASHQEMSVAAAVERVTLPPNLTEAQDPADVESVVLEEMPKQALRPPAGVQQAWEHEAQQPMPPEGITRPALTKEVEKSAEKPAEAFGLAQSEEPLFIKLCSPAHRRTAALAILSAQSSLDESSSSLASRSRSVSPLRSKHHDALLIGLSTGMFDSNNPKMLRTCSLPDLSRLFSAQQDSAATTANAAPDNNLEIEDLDEAAKVDDQSEAEDAYEDEDLRDIRASMERLLQEEGDLMRSPAEVGAGDFNGNPSEGEDQELFNSIAADMDHENNQMAVDDDEDDDDDEEEDEEEEEEEEEDVEEEDEEDEDEECSNGSPGDEDAGELLSNGVGEENLTNTCQLNEEWQSDGSVEDQGVEAAQHDSIFSRLEELRFNLEQQMGFEKFIEAYNKIKAIHEDEDENIDLGSSFVLSILGTEHQHLYPNILHLVMADGAYQEDNDE
ncbi:serine/threonine-protein kinase Nek1 isoform X2 [Larimichthys crocea]|uniref:serine/threonine-protein kinase Nek1 isoform X2 n=1 Tax=Larimichthys crocea TaxID=215358 RepID=UPI000F5F2835|nr:serine/threonine-protein kinase Nek1 isoform X2 [Larimichthys crocea]